MLRHCHIIAEHLPVSTLGLGPNHRQKMNNEVNIKYFIVNNINLKLLPPPHSVVSQFCLTFHSKVWTKFSHKSVMLKALTYPPHCVTHHTGMVSKCQNIKKVVQIIN